MSYEKEKLGNLIKPVYERNNLGIREFFGLNISKEFMPTAASTDNLDESKYKVVRRNRFVFSGMQTGRDKTIRISMYEEDQPVLVSPAYTTFEVYAIDRLLPDYLYMRFLSAEMDRYGWFLSDGSVRANLDWPIFCDIEICLPPLEVQKRYVDLYKRISESLVIQETTATVTRSAFEAVIERVRTTHSVEKIGAHISPTDQRNKGGELALETLRGISIDKVLIPTKANMNGVSLTNYKVVRPGAIAFVPVTSRNGNKMSIAINNTNSDVLVSSINQVLECNSSTLLPEYLMLFLSRPEFDRYARFHSWGSARETFNWDDMRDVKIPVPPIDVQESVTALSHAHFASTSAAARTKELLKDLCPVLIKGSLDEARREEATA